MLVWTGLELCDHTAFGFSVLEFLANTNIVSWVLIFCISLFTRYSNPTSL